MKYIITEEQFTYLNKCLIEQTETNNRRLLYYPNNLSDNMVRLMNSMIEYAGYEYTYDFFKTYKGLNDASIIEQENKWYNEVIECYNQAVDFYTKHFSKPDTISKLKNPESGARILEFLKKIPFALIMMGPDVAGKAFPTKNPDNYFMFINILHAQKNLCETVRHEMGHVIDYYLRYGLGEKTIDKIDPIHKEDPNKKAYLSNEFEIFSNMQGFRKFFTIEPKDDGKTICDKIENYFNSNALPDDVASGFVRSGNDLIFKVADVMTPKIISKTIIEGVRDFFNKIFDNHDVESLFANFSYFNPTNKTITLYCDKLAQTNITTVDASSKKRNNQGLA